MLYLIGEILIYLIIATSMGLLAGWAVTSSSARQKLANMDKKFNIQLNDRSNAVKQLKETLQDKIKEVDDLEYELMRRTADRPEKLIGQGNSERVRAYENNINEALDIRDQRIAELEAELKKNNNGNYDHEDIIIDANDVSDVVVDDSVIDINNSVINEPIETRSPMQILETELKNCLNRKKDQGETPELREEIERIKSDILNELKSKGERQVA